MRDLHDIHIDIDTDYIHQTVHRAVSDAMEQLHDALEGIHDLPFGEEASCEPGWQHLHRERRAAGAEQRHAERVDETADAAPDATRSVLQALERGDISVDEAMEQLGEDLR